jgi:thiol-disulfide isomerase/thioredoxin
MKKLTLSLIGLILLFVNAIGQTVIDEGVLKYKEIKSKSNKGGSEIKTFTPHSFEFSNKFFKHSYLLKEKALFTTVCNLETKQTKSYITNWDKYYFMDEPFQPSFFELGLYNENKPNILFSDDPLIINNFKCKKATYKYQINGNQQQIEVWYSTDFRIKLSNIDNIFKELDGIPLKFSFVQQPKLASGINGTPTNCEFIIDTFYQTKKNKIDIIENEDKYSKIENKEKGSRIMEILMGTKTNIDKPKGEAITQVMTPNNEATLSLTSYNPFKVGEKLKNFKGITYDGIEKSIEDYKGRILVINFWFNKCKPCIKEMPLLNKVVQEYKDKGVLFLSITYNSKKEVSEFTNTHQFDFEKITDAQSIIDLYGVSTYPTTIIIDRENTIRFIKIGAFEKEKELQNEIDKIAK